METYVTDWEISQRTKKLLLSANINTLDDLLLKTKEDLLSIGGFGKSALDEVSDYLYFNFKQKLKKKEKQKKVDNYSDCKEIIEHLLGTKGFSWPREILAAKKLLDRYKKSVILNIQPPNNIKSIAWLLGEWGESYIAKNRSDLTLVKQDTAEEKIELLKEEADNYKPLLDGYKPQRLKDFLKKNGI